MRSAGIRGQCNVPARATVCRASCENRDGTFPNAETTGSGTHATSPGGLKPLRAVERRAVVRLDVAVAVRADDGESGTRVTVVQAGSGSGALRV